MDTGSVTVWLPLAWLVLARVAGIVFVAPVFSHAAVPVAVVLFLVVGGGGVNLAHGFFALF